MEILARLLGHAESYYRSVQSSRAVGERLIELFADHDTLDRRGHRPIPEERSIEADRLCFQHAGSERGILKDISFKISPGEIVAVAGRNGAGKSTLMDLLLRLYDPTSGRILIGGVDLRELDVEAWRRSTGI